LKGSEELADGAGRGRDLVGDRRRLIGIGMVAVFSACTLFGAARLAVTLTSGRPTPWWANGAGALAIGLLWAWYRRDPGPRSAWTAGATAAVATAVLIAPVAYGMPSTVWWLSLVGFAMVLLGRRKEATAWGIGIPLVVAAAVFAEPFVQVAGGAGEPPLERALARVAFTVLLVGMAAGFRKVANERAEELERANAARGRFLAHVSHEIRTPLHGVLSMTELALRAPIPPEARQQVETAHDSARVLLGLLNNILDITRAESDAVVLESAPFDLHAALGEVLRPLAAQARERGVSFSATADPGIPSRRRGDRFRVSQVALNLAGNAVKFTPSGRVEVRLLRVSGRRGGDEVALRVVDTGPGIEPGLRESLFRPFSQGEAARSRGGSGLGLAIVRELVRRMDGGVAVESEPGKGSTFTATMRLAVEGPEAGGEDLLRAGEERRGASGVPDPGEGGPGAGARLRILVCEDDPVNRKVVSAMLRKLRHDAQVVTTAEEAWEALLDGDYDLLLTDIELPGMNGDELARRVRARERERGLPRMPIVAGTAHVGKDEGGRLRAAGVDAHLTKPFSIPELAGALEDARDVATRFQ
jgi:signal transduction histidine kinase